MDRLHRIFAGAGACAILLLASCSTPPALSTASIPAIREIDMSRYQGKWYEIARLPVPIGQTWVNTSDNYTLNPDGSVAVVYEGFEGSPQGKRRTLKGRQWIPDPRVMGETLISFIPLVANQNRIILLDPGYRYLVVTSHSKELLWVMSKTPRMEEADYRFALEKAREWGFDVSKLEKVRQEWSE